MNYLEQNIKDIINSTTQISDENDYLKMIDKYNILLDQVKHLAEVIEFDASKNGTFIELNKDFKFFIKGLIQGSSYIDLSVPKNLYRNFSSYSKEYQLGKKVILNFDNCKIVFTITHHSNISDFEEIIKETIPSNDYSKIKKVNVSYTQAKSILEVITNYSLESSKLSSLNVMCK